MRFIFQRIGINLQIPLIVPARRKFEGHLIALHLRQPSAEVVNDPREGNFVRFDRSGHHFLGANGVGVDFWHGGKFILFLDKTNVRALKKTWSRIPAPSFSRLEMMIFLFDSCELRH
uniref:(northern house mosquito) hypothetical protein n=2 Tax=Culex pipiens TaxID=7175 RepID=A0A8D8BQC5_CULPI